MRFKSDIVAVFPHRMQSVQDPRQPPARRNTPTSGYANLEAGSRAEMPVVPERPIRPAGAYDQADRDTGDHAQVWVQPDEER
jgi:hypothetical protein